MRERHWSGDLDLVGDFIGGLMVIVYHANCAGRLGFCVSISTLMWRGLMEMLD